MLRYILLYTLFLFFSPIAFIYSIEINDFKFQAYNRPFATKEEFYSLYRENLYGKVDNLNANIFWLEQAKKAPWAIPVKAFAKIETPAQWAEYKSLFLFHIEFLMMDNYLKLAQMYEKQHVLFFNTIFKKEIKEGFEIAKIYDKRALLHLNNALTIAKKAWAKRDDVPLSPSGEVDKWIDTVYRLQNINIYHRMNFKKEILLRLTLIDKKLDQLQKL